MGQHSEAQLDRKVISFLKLMNIYLNHFPSHEKYGIALEIRRAAYEMYALIVLNRLCLYWAMHARRIP